MSDDTGWTRIPNDVLDAALCDQRLHGAAFRVLMAIARKTYGWRKDADAISYGQLQALTGIQSPATIRAAIVELTSAGYIDVTTGGKWDAATYRISTTITVVEQPTTITVATTINEADTTTITVVEPTTVIVDTKEIYKEKKEKGTAPRKRGGSSRPRDIVFETVANVCGIDWSVCTEAQRHQLNQTTATLRRSAEKQQVDESGTLDRIRHTERYWYRVDWRGKQQQPPTPAQLREVWGAAMKTYHARAPASVAPGEPEPTPADVAAYLRSKRNGSTPTPE